MTYTLTNIVLVLPFNVNSEAMIFCRNTKQSSQVSLCCHWLMG